ncbi:MAG: hypothetical protein KME26_20305 [Oscillatoria princeps RMCB-10]|nr:hypothetical protein [Oscillatoria princeps RMCB-10]
MIKQNCKALLATPGGAGWPDSCRGTKPFQPELRASAATAASSCRFGVTLF